MNRLSRMFALLLTVLVTGTFTADTCARGRMYNPRTGQFMQRDPLGTAIVPMGFSTTAPARNISSPQFTQRDPNIPSQLGQKSETRLFTTGDFQRNYGLLNNNKQYADGMSLYQYVGSNPITRVDSVGYKWQPISIRHCKGDLHAYVRLGGDGYGFYWEAHANYTATFWDSLEAASKGGWQGVVYHNDATRYSHIPCYEILVDDCVCDVGKFEEAVKQAVLSDYNIYNLSTTNRRYYHASLNNCYSWSSEMIRAGTKACNQRVAARRTVVKTGKEVSP